MNSEDLHVDQSIQTISTVNQVAGNWNHATHRLHKYRTFSIFTRFLSLGAGASGFFCQSQQPQGKPIHFAILWATTSCTHTPHQTHHTNKPHPILGGSSPTGNGDRLLLHCVPTPMKVKNCFGQFGILFWQVDMVFYNLQCAVSVCTATQATTLCLSVGVWWWLGYAFFCSHVQSTLLTYMWVPHTYTHPKSQHCVYQLEFGGGWAMPFLQPCTITHCGHTCGSHTHVLYLCVVFTLVNSESSPSSSTSWSPS